MEIAKLEINPGDILVVKVGGNFWGEEKREGLKMSLKRLLPEGVGFMLVDGNLDLAVLKKGK